jgi:hypothetical protein
VDPPAPAAPAQPAPFARIALSTAEKTKINSDPAVQEILSLFSGTLTDIRRTAGPEAAADDEPASE